LLLLARSCISADPAHLPDEHMKQHTDEQPTEEQRAQMLHYGILPRQKTQYTYQGYVYDRLTDAVEYARIDGELEARRAGADPRS
jgi:hypothetical protein